MGKNNCQLCLIFRLGRKVVLISSGVLGTAGNLLTVLAPPYLTLFMVGRFVVAGAEITSYSVGLILGERKRPDSQMSIIRHHRDRTKLVDNRLSRMA